MSKLNLTTLTKDLNVISKLSDLPNVKDGLSPDELKAKFDVGNNEIKKFINETMIAELEEKAATKLEIQGIVLGDIPDNSLTSDKFLPAIQDGIDGSRFTYKFIEVTVDDTKSTTTDIYFNLDGLTVSSLNEGQKVLIHTPEYASTGTKFYLNDTEIKTIIIPDKDYELIYENELFKASSYEENIFRLIEFKQLTIDSSQASISVSGRCLGAIWSNMEVTYVFKNATFTYDPETNTTTFPNPKIEKYGTSNNYAWGFGIFIK